MTENNQLTLPPLGDDSVARIEKAVFAEIADEERESISTAAVREPRRRRWPTVLGVAAAFVVGALVTPAVIGALDNSGVPGARSADISAESGGYATEDASMDAGGDGQEREIITTAEVSLRVPVIQDAVDEVSSLAEQNGGYVESANVRNTSGEGGHERSSMAGGTITVRIPVEKLTGVMAALGDGNDVLRSSVSREDVTGQAVDLRARVDALSASVARLTELMAKSGSVGDLIQAETALSERQAELESYQQQLKQLDDQVAMSTLTVALTERTSQADPNLFGEGLLAGWNGLIASLNALVVVLGFLLPWLAIAGVVVLVVWLVRRRSSKA